MWDLIVSVPDHCLPFYFSKIFNDDIYVTFETRLIVAFIQTASYVPVCTYYAHYVYSVIRITIYCMNGA